MDATKLSEAIQQLKPLNECDEYTIPQILGELGLPSCDPGLELEVKLELKACGWKFRETKPINGKSVTFWSPPKSDSPKPVNLPDLGDGDIRDLLLTYCNVTYRVLSVRSNLGIEKVRGGERIYGRIKIEGHVYNPPEDGEEEYKG